MLHRIGKSGFSLVEMAIVIIITATIAGAVFKIVPNVTADSQEKNTQAKLDELNAAIVAFVKQNNRLPCPADITLATSNTGFGFSQTNCNASIAGDITLGSYSLRNGMIPVRTLGLSDDYAFDAWGNRIRYAAIKELTISSQDFESFLTNFTGLSPNTRTFEIRDGASLSGNATTPVNTYTSPTVNNSIAYLLLSHGVNGNGAVPFSGGTPPTCPASGLLDEENCNGDAIFRDAIYSTGTSNYFDDIIRYKTYNQLRFEAGIFANTSVVPTSADTMQVAFVYDGVSALNNTIGLNHSTPSFLSLLWNFRAYNTIIKNFAINPANTSGGSAITDLAPGTYLLEASSYFFSPVDVDVGIAFNTTVGLLGQRVFRAQANRSYYLTTSTVYSHTANSAVGFLVRLSSVEDVRFVNNLSLGGTTQWPYFVMTITRLK